MVGLSVECLRGGVVGLVIIDGAGVDGHLGTGRIG